MHVGARHAVGRDGRAPRADAGVDRPAGCLLGYEQPGFDRGEVVGQSGEVQVLRYDAMVHGQHGLHETQHAGGGFGMSEVALDRGERTRSRGAIHGGHAGELDRVADRGSRAMCLDHADRRGFDAGGRQCRPKHGDLGIT